MPIRISAVQPSKRSGFTFIEIVVVLLIVSVLAYTAGVSLVNVLKTEEVSMTMAEHGLMLQTMAARRFVGLPPTDALPEGKGPWTLFATSVPGGPGSPEGYEVWELSHADRPSLTYRMAFQNHGE